MKKKKTLTLVILIMLVLVAASAVWIMHRERTLEAERGMQTQQAEEQAEEEAAAEEDADDEDDEDAEEPAEETAEEDSEDARVASHIYSNRGSAGAEEHSFKAYDAAIDAGSRCIGVDVVMSSDKVLYVSSDDNALEMTGYNGMYEYISSETVDGLRTEAGNKVLRLSEVFDHYGKDINYVIELKNNSDACILAFENMVTDYGLADVITVGSMNAETLELIEKKFPDMPKLFVCWNQGAFSSAVDMPYVDIISVRADVETGILTESNCEAAHSAGKKFSAWTLDTEEDIKRGIDTGVDTYFTNDTALALSVEKEYGLSVRR